MRDVLEKLASIAHDDKFSDSVDEIRREIKSFDAALKAAEDDGRDLVIAIVGRVKSGKSSFLNALLFDGESVLPQAATPMTAALTFIRYDKKCHAEVEFFSKGDWEGFEAKAKAYADKRQKVLRDLESEEAEAERRAKRSYRKYTRREITDARIDERLRVEMGDETLAAVELVRMAKESGNCLDLNDCLGRTQRIDGNSPQELAEKLRDYVGARGRFTPIVCSTTIYLNDPGLNGYCVIDTPGTNDPVISRGKKTKDNLKKSDVVLVMSPAGRFFDDSDLRLCSQNLPANGINDFVILISQFDAAIGEIECKIDRSLPPASRMLAAIRKARNDLITRFRQCISNIAQRAAANKNADVEKWQRLLKEDPILVSAKAYIVAKHWDLLDESRHESEKAYLEIFNELIPGFTFDREHLRDFSMMESVKKRLEKVKQKKNETIARRKGELAGIARKRVSEMLIELRDDVKSSIDKLESADIARLKSELEEQTRRLKRGQNGLEEVFVDTISQAHDKFNEILSEVREAKSHYARLNVESETHQGVNTSYVMRGGLGFMDWLLGPKEVRQHYTYTTKYADAYQAVEQVDAFADKARRLLERGIRCAVDMKTLQKNIVSAVFDIIGDDETFSPEDLKRQIRSTVSAIVIPDADFGNVNFTELITSSFTGGRVENGQIEILKCAQREAIQNVVGDLEERTRSKASAIEESLKHAMNTFVDGLIGNIQKNNEQLAASVKDKVATSQRWESHLQVIDELYKSCSEDVVRDS